MKLQSCNQVPFIMILIKTLPSGSCSVLNKSASRVYYLLGTPFTFSGRSSCFNLWFLYMLYIFFKIIDTDGIMSVSNRVHDKREHIVYAIE